MVFAYYTGLGNATTLFVWNHIKHFCCTQRNQGKILLSYNLCTLWASTTIFFNLSLLYDAFEASSRGLLCVASEFGKALVLLPDVQKFWTLCSIDCMKLPICSSQWDVSRAGISFLWNWLLMSDSADCDYKFKPVYGTTQGLCQTCRRQVGMLPSSQQRHEFTVTRD